MSNFKKYFLLKVEMLFHKDGNMQNIQLKNSPINVQDI